jgi:hypothetical protein
MPPRRGLCLCVVNHTHRPRSPDAQSDTTDINQTGSQSAAVARYDAVSTASPIQGIDRPAAPPEYFAPVVSATRDNFGTRPG